MKNYSLLNIISLKFLCITLVFSVQVLPQSNHADEEIHQIWESGVPYITHYTPDEYKAHVQNWCFIQDNNGIMYVGNTSGILEYDGVLWRLIKLPNSSPAKSFAKTSDNIIYVGAVRVMGYLQPDSVGQMKFHSIISHLDTAYHNFADIWFTYAVGTSVYFISDHYIFKWYNNQFKVWEAKEGFGFASLVNDQIYIEKNGIGLMHLLDDILVLIPDGDKFQGKKGNVTTMLAYDDNRILMGHSVEGLFLYDHHKITPLKKESKNLLHSKFIYNGILLPNGNYAFVTLGNGCFILDEKSNIKQWLGKTRGLNSDGILGLYVDREGSLWLAVEDGINRVEISSPFRIFGQQSGLTEVVDRVIIHNKRFYAACRDGAFYLSEITSEAEKKEYYFQKIDGINRTTMDFISKNKSLLVANFHGVYEITSNRKLKLLLPENTFEITHSSLDTNLVFAGTNSGFVYALRLKNNEWRVDKSNLSIRGRIYRMVEDADGSLWLSTRYNGVYRVHFLPSNHSRSFDKNYSLVHYDTSNGLPGSSYNIVFQVNSENYFSTHSGIYRYNKMNQEFYPDTLIMNQLELPVKQSDYIIEASNDGGMWLTKKSNFINKVYKSERGVLNEVIASKRFSDFGVYEIYDKNDIIFFCGPKGILAYNKKLESDYKTHFAVQLRKVIVSHDSLLFAEHSSEQNYSNPISLSYNNNSLRFIYALPSYDKTEANRYQYYLEGYDNNWSDWSTETQRDFTNLPEGDYIFHLKGMNVYSSISNETQFAFTILPPLHRTWWAYLIYAFVGMGLIGLVVHWRSKHLIQEKEILENIVNERTHQLAEQTKKLAAQTDQLKVIDQQKSRFFANISHEFRTPLTLIKGPVEQAKESQKLLSEEDAMMIGNNAERLLRLVNQLMDISKLDADSLELTPSQGDIFGFLRTIGSAFSSHAEQRNINYQIQVPESKLSAVFDHDKLEKIIFNLLSNTFKFTSDSGKIILKALYSDGILTIEVHDSGIGISEEQLPFIFDRFYQSDDSSSRAYEGTGIGLSLAKELTALMKGDIQVESQQGIGSKFIITLPMVAETIPFVSRHIKEEDGKKHEPATKIGKELLSDKKISSFSSENRISSEEKNETETPIILIVEDNPDMRGFIIKQLEDNYRILESSQGIEGLKTATKEIPDLIITDLMMPQMDGIALCKKLKTNEYTNHIPIIMLTAKVGQEHKIEGLETGADSYLTKPFDRKELQVMVNNLINQRKLLREKYSRELFLEPKHIDISSLDEQFLKKVINCVENNLSDADFGISQMQDILAMSKTQLHRKLKALSSQAPGEFLRNYRLKRASQMIANKVDSVTQIAYSVGFNNLSYFAKCFKELYGLAPSEFSANSKNQSFDS